MLQKLGKNRPCGPMVNTSFRSTNSKLVSRSWDEIPKLTSELGKALDVISPVLRIISNANLRSTNQEIDGKFEWKKHWDFV